MGMSPYVRVEFDEPPFGIEDGGNHGRIGVARLRPRDEGAGRMIEVARALAVPEEQSRRPVCSDPRIAGGVVFLRGQVAQVALVVFPSECSVHRTLRITKRFG